jgi:hypothetical protein
MLGSIVLNDTLEAIKLKIRVTLTAKEKFLTVLLRMGFDLGIKHPLHVLQSQFPGIGTSGRIHFGFTAGSANGGFVLGNLCIEPLAHIHQDLSGKRRAVVLGHFVSASPGVTDGLVSIPTNPESQRCLYILPFTIDVFQFRSRLDVLVVVFLGSLLNHSGLSQAFVLPLLGIMALGNEPGLQNLPGTII